ncbi:MAG: hypothetical protein PHN72_04635 [Bacilli bacterium]|nr:hypothetical protein [Bacilli bacterium]
MGIDFDKYILKASYLTVEEFQKQFDTLWDTLKYSFKKFECLQYYEEGEQCPLLDLQQNDIETFSKKLNKIRKTESPFYKEALKKGVQLERLHIIEFPISQYIEYEYYTYYITSSLGENIYFKNSKEIINKNMKDFIIFDSTNVLIHDYDQNGNLQGAWWLSEEHQELISSLEKWYDTQRKNAHPFYKITIPNEEIIKMIL